MGEEQNYWTTVFRNRISRRGLLRGAIVGGAALGVAGALGCGDSEQPKASTVQTPSSSGPKKGGIFRFSTDTDAPTLDMHTQLSYSTNTPMGFVFDPLIRYAGAYNPDGTIQPGKYYPWLAESWENPDDTTYVFKLRKGVKFHNLPPVNGREMTSEDVKYSIERIRTPRPEFIRGSMFSQVASIDAPDKYTVKFKLKEAFAPFLNNVSDGWNVVVPHEVVEKDGDMNTTAIGTGPFQLDKWNRGVSFEFKRNPDFYMPGLPYLDAVKLMIIKDMGTRQATFRSGDIDQLASLFARDVEGMKQSVPNLQLKSVYASHPWIFMNNKVPPFNDKNVRKACQAATNVQDYIDMLWEGKGKRNGPMQFFLAPWALEEKDLPKFDLKAAKQYMAQSACPTGAKVVCDTTETLSSSIIMQIAQRQWKEIGIDLEFKMMDWGAWMQKVAVRKDYFVSAVTDYTYVDPNEWLFTYFHSTGTNNRTNYSNPEYDKLVEEQRRTLDEKKRIDMVLRLQKMLLEDASHIDLASFEQSTVLRPEVRNYQNYVYGGGGVTGFLYSQLWMDK